MKARILNSIGSNRSVAITYDPALDQDREDIPCLQFLQALVRDGELTINILRSLCQYFFNFFYWYFLALLLFLINLYIFILFTIILFK